MRDPARGAVFLFLFLGLGACDRGEPPPGGTAVSPVVTGGPGDTCRLTMGWDPWEPYHYKDPTGELHGLDIEIVSAAAAGAGCELDFVQDNFANLLRGVRTGEIDLVSGATLTPEREAYAFFSAPCRTETFALYIRTDDRDRYAAEDLGKLIGDGMRIGVTSDYIYGDQVSALQDDPTLAESFLAADLGETNAERLVNNEIDGWLEDVFVASAVIRRRGLDGGIEAHPATIGASTEVRLMFSRASVTEDVVARFNESLAHLRDSGEIDSIRGRYQR